MDKKTFIKTLEEFKAIEEDIQRVHSAMKKLSSDFGGFYMDRHATLIVNLLSMLMNDTSDWISYFIYELNWGKDARIGSVKSKNGKNIPIKNYNDLWNLITKYK